MTTANTPFLIDLISGQHLTLRSELARRWQRQSDLHLSSSEWHLLVRIEPCEITISQVASIIGVSRQAVQKSVKRLEEMDMLTAYYQAGNKRDKYLTLTDNGRAVFAQYLQLKTQLDDELTAQLGMEQMAKLKEIFAKEWVQTSND